MRGSLSAILLAMTLLPTWALSQSGNSGYPAILPLKARLRQAEGYQRRKRQTPNISEPLRTGVSASGNVEIEGLISRDAVAVAGLQVQDFQFGLITNQSAAFGVDPFDGIVGMGFPSGLTTGSQTFLNALHSSGQISRAIYGLYPYLTPQSVGHAEISLGGVDSSKLTSEINYIPVFPATDQFNGTFEKVRVDNRTTNVSSNFVNYDSGTANIVAPKNDAEAIYAMISPDIRPIDAVGTYGIPCSKLKDIKSSISFIIEGHNYTIPSQELNVGPIPDQPGICQTLINSTGGDQAKSLWVIGGSLLKDYYTVWDIENARFGLAQTLHSP
ncbi:aspartic peptidase domain-containing protein [Trichoderma pleuroticola]